MRSTNIHLWAMCVWRYKTITQRILHNGWYTARLKSIFGNQILLSASWVQRTHTSDVCLLCGSLVEAAIPKFHYQKKSCNSQFILYNRNNFCSCKFIIENMTGFLIVVNVKYCQNWLRKWVSCTCTSHIKWMCN